MSPHCSCLGWLLVRVGAQLMEWGDHLLPPVDHELPTDADHRWQGIVLRAASDILDELEAEHEADRAERRAVLAEAAAITRYPLDD